MEERATKRSEKTRKKVTQEERRKGTGRRDARSKEGKRKEEEGGTTLQHEPTQEHNSQSAHRTHKSTCSAKELTSCARAGVASCDHTSGLEATNCSYWNELGKEKEVKCLVTQGTSHQSDVQAWLKVYYYVCRNVQMRTRRCRTYPHAAMYADGVNKICTFADARCPFSGGLRVLFLQEGESTLCESNVS